MTGKLTTEEAKKSLSPGTGSGKKGWFGSKARNHVAFTIHCEPEGGGKPQKRKAK